MNPLRAFPRRCHRLSRAMGREVLHRVFEPFLRGLRLLVSTELVLKRVSFQIPITAFDPLRSKYFGGSSCCSIRSLAAVGLGLATFAVLITPSCRFLALQQSVLSAQREHQRKELPKHLATASIKLSAGTASAISLLGSLPSSFSGSKSLLLGKQDASATGATSHQYEEGASTAPAPSADADAKSSQDSKTKDSSDFPLTRAQEIGRAHV